MNRTVIQTTSSLPHQDFKDNVHKALDSIPGMAELRKAGNEAEYHRLQLLYPDAAFARMIASSLFCSNRELSSIYLHAYRSIMQGQKISAVRHCFEQQINAYWSEHMWDD